MSLTEYAFNGAAEVNPEVAKRYSVMTLKKIAAAGVAAFASVWLSTAAMAIPFPADDGVLNDGDVDSYTTAGIAKNSSFVQVLDFTADVNKVILDFASTSNFGGSLSNYTFSFIDLTTSAVIASNVNVLGGPSTFIYSLVSGNNYRIQLALSASGAGGRNARSFGAVTVSTIPVPPAVVLMVSGLLGAGYMGRRKSKTKAVV
jgi:hypothetical protein